MGVLLRKIPSLFEVYNDLDTEVVNFFRVLREEPDALIQAIQMTPYSREEQKLAFESTEGVSDLERARRLYTRCWQSHGGGRTQWRTGWRYQVSNKRGRSQIEDWNQIEHLEAIVKRLKNVQIEHDDAIRVITRYDRPDTLFYIDPPYLMHTRSIRWGKKAYTCELDDAYHVRLAEVLKQVQGMVLISGKPSPMYDDLYAGWFCARITVPTDFQSSTVECLWVSPKTMSKQRQMSLFTDLISGGLS